MRSDRSVLCSGSCGRVFHPGCVGLNATNFKSWTANVGLLWFCENCRVNFNPSIMDREAVIMKTLRELLLRVDSMDLRVGQFGENLKALNTLMSSSTTFKRDSNFSSRLQHAMSGTTIYDPTEFYNTIDRFNLDLSLRSNVANNTIVDEDEELEAALENDDPRSDHHEDVMTANNAMTATSKTSTSTTSAPTTTVTTAVAAVAAAVPRCATTAAAVNTSSATNVPTSYAAIVSRPASTVNTVQNSVSNSSNSVMNNMQQSNGIPNAIASTSSNTNVRTLSASPNTPPASTSSAPQRLINAVNDCRLKVVNRNHPARHAPNDEIMKSFYLTPFDVGQSEEDIIEYLRETINVDNSTLKCVKLVPRNKNVDELSFVSFKLSVSEDLVSVISDPFYWPEGVEVREFQPKNGSIQNRVASIRIA